MFLKSVIVLLLKSVIFSAGTGEQDMAFSNRIATVQHMLLNPGWLMYDCKILEGSGWITAQSLYNPANMHPNVDISNYHLSIERIYKLLHCNYSKVIKKICTRVIRLSHECKLVHQSACAGLMTTSVMALLPLLKRMVSAMEFIGRLMYEHQFYASQSIIFKMVYYLEHLYDTGKFQDKFLDWLNTMDSSMAGVCVTTGSSDDNQEFMNRKKYITDLMAPTDRNQMKICEALNYDFIQSINAFEAECCSSRGFFYNDETRATSVLTYYARGVQY